MYERGKYSEDRPSWSRRRGRRPLLRSEMHERDWRVIRDGLHPSRWLWRLLEQDIELRREWLDAQERRGVA